MGQRAKTGTEPVAYARDAAELLLNTPGAAIGFQYVGHTALTLIGPASGRRYSFTPGSILAVDPRDRSALASIPLLRRR
jgi:hypothetical protein